MNRRKFFSWCATIGAAAIVAPTAPRVRRFSGAEVIAEVRWPSGAQAEINALAARRREIFARTANSEWFVVLPPGTHRFNSLHLPPDVQLRGAR